jgi:hypothetical protein
MKLLLHIGTHKAGSSTIQHLLWHNRERLQKEGFLYPQMPNGQVGHHDLAWAIRSSTGGRTPRQVDRAILTKLNQKLQRSGCHTAIISSEEFEFATTPDQLRMIRKQLPADLTQIVVYLRRQDKYLVSEYGQHLKMPETRFSGSIHDFYMRYNFANRFNYMRALTRWANVFGAENVIVRPFEPGQFANGNLLDDVRETFGLADSGLEAPPNLTVNKGLSGPACVLLSHANRHDLDPDAHRRLVDLIYRHEERLAAAPFELLSSRNIADLMAQFADSNAKVAQTFLDRPDGQLFREPLPEGASYGEAGVPPHYPMIDYMASLLVETVRNAPKL